MNATTTQNNHFNLHVSGVGYINRIRWVTPKQGGRKAQPFLACSIAALRGNSDEPDYTYFDLRVSGEEARHLVEQAMKDVEDGRKVVVSFKVGDIYPHKYDRNVKVDGRMTGEKETACLIKGRLLLINTVTVDGERIYARQTDEADQAQPNGSVSSEPLGDDEFQDSVSAGEKQQVTASAPAQPVRNAPAQPARRVSRSYSSRQTVPA